MSKADSRIPQKVAALADALEAVRRHIGFGSELDLSFYSCLPPTDSAAVPRDGTLEDARKEVLAAAAKFVEAVDTAERLLNATPVSALEPLSPYTGGVRWDVGTRRTLKEIDAIISGLRKTSTDLDFLFSKRGVFGKARFEEMQSKLKWFLDELPKRIFDLQCLPSQEEDDPLKPIDNAKVDRNDWLLEMRGKDNKPKMTEIELSNALLKKCEEEPNWVHMEPRSIPAALREAYKRQTENLWPFDGRGRTKKTGK